VDPVSGEVLFTTQPARKTVSFEDAVLEVKKNQDSASDRFDQAFEKEKGRKDLIDLKFKEAMERADELEQPLRDIDLE
jgi:pimeloyl-CoA synthetase